MKKYEFLLIFRTFFYVLAHISPEWESIWICNFFEVIEWHKDYTLLKFWRNRFSHSWEKYDQNFKIFDFWQKLCIYLTINPKEDLREIWKLVTDMLWVYSLHQNQKNTSFKRHLRSLWHQYRPNFGILTNFRRFSGDWEMNNGRIDLKIGMHVVFYLSNRLKPFSLPSKWTDQVEK